MTQVAQAALTMVGLNTPTPTVFWNGKAIPDIFSITTSNKEKEAVVKLQVFSIDKKLKAELQAANISVRKVTKK